MDARELLRACDRSVARTLRHLAAYAHGGECHEGDGLLLTGGAYTGPSPYVNAAFRTDAALAPGEVLRRAREFFAARDSGFVIWASTHDDDDLGRAAIAGGARIIGDPGGSPEMVLDEAIGPPPPPPSAVLVRVADTPGIDLFRDVVGRSYADRTAPEKKRLVFGDPRLLLHPDVAAFLVRAEAAATACAMALVAEGVAEIGFVGTVPEARGRSFGETVTRAAAAEGFRRGSTMAALQASPMGEPVYRRIGFREVTRYRRYAISV